MSLAVALFFALFCVPAMVLAVLAARDFLHRDAPGDREARLRRATWLLLGAGALPVALVVATTVATAGAPLRAGGGAVFLGWGAACALLAAAGAWLLRRAAAAPLRRTVKAAETVPMLLVLLQVVLLYNAAVQAP